MNDINFVTRRAAAEGFNVSKILSAAKELQEEGVIEAESTGIYNFEEQLTLKEMAARIARAAYYTGGYMYPGSDFGSLRAYQPWYHSRVGESTDADESTIVAVLTEMPVGTEVVEKTDFGNGIEFDFYRRTSDGFLYYKRDSEIDRKFYRNQNHTTPDAVAKKLGVSMSSTFLSVYDEAMVWFY